MSKQKNCNAFNEEQDDRVKFTEEMRKDYTILIPNMLPRHFKILSKVFQYYGYNAYMLGDSEHSDTKAIINAGLRNVHNDACYPVTIIIGQLINALESGNFDPHKTAFLMTQTGGGCRASNYIALIRKALKKSGYEYVPVISLNFAGLEENPGFKITLPMIHRAMYAILYGDLFLSLVNQTKPYEKVPGSAEKLADEWTDRLVEEMTHKRIKYSHVKSNYDKIIHDFASIPMERTPKVKVGIVGEIFVKFSPLANNNLENYLIRENAEPVMEGLIGFILYCVYNSIIDYKLYGKGKKSVLIFQLVLKFFESKQMDVINAIKKEGTFTPPPAFSETRKAHEGYVGSGMKMGEGWLLVAEMLELTHHGINNIVCTQPFGCLPNHIVGKGMIKPVKERNEGVNIVSVDYDSGATRINQENRIKLMLANAQQNIMQMK